MTVSVPIAIVTGSSHRIGRAIVEDLADHGWAVAIHYGRSRDDAEALADKIRRAGGKACSIGADLADLNEARRVVPETVARLGPPTLLVNNASIFERDEVGGLDPTLWTRQLTVNLAAPVFLAEAFAKALPDDREGNIVNLVDQRVWKPTPRFFSYQISKSALWAATEVLAQALAPRIRVNAIAPGPALPSVHGSAEAFRKTAHGVLLEHGPDLGEFGRTVRFLVENRSITGTVVGLDGGQHLVWETRDIAPAKS